MISSHFRKVVVGAVKKVEAALLSVVFQEFFIERTDFESGRTLSIRQF